MEPVDVRPQNPSNLAPVQVRELLIRKLIRNPPKIFKVLEYSETSGGYMIDGFYIPKGIALDWRYKIISSNFDLNLVLWTADGCNDMGDERQWVFTLADLAAAKMQTDSTWRLGGVSIEVLS